MFGAETMKFFIKPLNLLLVLIDWDNRKKNSYTIFNFSNLIPVFLFLHHFHTLI